MQTNNRNDLTDNELLREAAALALEETLAGPDLPDDEGIDALLSLLEETGEPEPLPNDVLEKEKQKTLRALRRKRRLSPRRILAVAAVLAVLVAAAVFGVLEQSGRIDLLPSDGPGETQQGPLQVNELLESLHNHAFQNVTLSNVFLQDGWLATAPTYYAEGGKHCADFQVYSADSCYCFSLKTGEASAEDYAALGAERVLIVEKEVVVYVFGNIDTDMSEMRYQLNNLTYSVTANVPTQTMIDTANLIENT